MSIIVPPLVSYQSETNHWLVFNLWEQSRLTKPRPIRTQRMQSEKQKVPQNHSKEKSKPDSEENTEKHLETKA
ncbi:MAG: hypothetical protein ACLTRS_09925 [Lachnospiraceae bacterium]